jgi:hypothetical protein
MRSIAAALILVGGLFIAGCAVLPGVNPTDLSSVQEETAARSEVETALGEPDLSRATDKGRIDAYLYDRGADVETYFSANPMTWLMLPAIWLGTPFIYAGKVDEQESYLTVVYDKQDRVVDYAVWPNAETPEEANTFYERRAEDRAQLDRELATAEACAKDFAKGVRECDAEAIYELAYKLNDLSKAWRFYCVSAHHGHDKARYALGNYYRWGRGLISPEPVRAYLWYTLAGDTKKSLQFKEQVASEMTHDQIAEAERLVAEWQPNPAECEVEGKQAEN